MKVPCFVCERARYDAGSGCFRGKLKEPEAEEVVLKCINQRLERQRDEEECRERELQGQGEDSLKLDNEQKKSRNVLLEKNLDALKVEKQYLYEQFKRKQLYKDVYLDKVGELREEERMLVEEIRRAKEKKDGDREQQERGNCQRKVRCLTKEIVEQMVEAIYVYEEKKLDVVWKEKE